ncbi:MAG: DUF4340 domain-containing protein [Candidatus Zixiibacteriota bacterium]|nr:MAG: DUF4340 domain-containing protein [candidate division Zixibacteria bacterium]
MYQSEKQSLSEKEIGNFLAVDSGMVNKISIRRLGTVVEFQKVGEDWNVGDRGKLYLTEKGAVQPLADLAHMMSVGEIISSNPDKQMLFQVDTITGNRVTFYRDGNELASIIIGKAGADNQSTYVRKPESKDVYVAKGNFVRFLNRPASGYRDKTLLTIDTTQIATISFKSKDIDYRIGRQDSLWRIVPAKGEPANANPQKMSNLLRQLAQIRWNNSPPPGDTARPNFLQPTVAVDISMLDGSTRSLRFVEQGASENKSYYIQSPSGDETFIVYEYVVTNLVKKPDELK